MNAVIYARFSSSMQSELSIEAQVRACTDYADKHDLSISKIYKDEAVSGTTNKRTGYQNLLADAFNNRFDVILIHKYDRIARDLAEQANLDRKLSSLGIRLIAVAQDFGEGKEAALSKGIQWVLGEYYSKNLAEETRKGLNEIALRGLFCGGVPPFGYDIVDQRYVINPIEADYVKKFFDSTISGISVSPLLEEIKNLGLVGKRGKEIKYTQVYEMLRNEKYTGTFIYCPIENKNREDKRNKKDAIRIEHAFPAIVSQKTFDDVQEILKSRKRNGKQTHRLSGIVYCSCGSKMWMSARKNKKGEITQRIFVCPDCRLKVPVDTVDNVVDGFLDSILSPKKEAEIYQALIRYKEDEKKYLRQFKIEQNKLITEKQNALNGIIKVLASGQFTNADFLDAEITRLRTELETAKNMKPDFIPDSRIRLWIDQIKQNKDFPKTYIESITYDGESFEIKSTLAKILNGNKKTTSEEVVGNHGCGGSIDILPTSLYRLFICRM